MKNTEKKRNGQIFISNTGNCQSSWLQKQAGYSISSLSWGVLENVVNAGPGGVTFDTAMIRPLDKTEAQKLEQKKVLVSTYAFLIIFFEVFRLCIYIYMCVCVCVCTYIFSFHSIV